MRVRNGEAYFANLSKKKDFRKKIETIEVKVDFGSNRTNSILSRRTVPKLFRIF